MKRLLLLIVLYRSFCSFDVAAMCIPGGLGVWPYIPDTVLELPRNPSLLLFWDGYRDKYMTELQRSGLFLKSGNDLVKLRFVRTYESNGCKTYMVKAVKELTPGRTYHLWSENTTVRLDQFSWKVRDHRDIKAPSWTEKPVFANNIYHQYGCGPEKFAVFCSCVTDDSYRIAIARLKDLRTGKVVENIIPPGMSFLEVGHGMCGGPFSFDSGRYEASFSLIDASGNQTVFTDPIAFDAPSPENSSKEYPTCVRCPDRQEEETALFYTVSMVFGILIASCLAVLFIIRRRKQKA